MEIPGSVAPNKPVEHPPLKAVKQQLTDRQ